MTLGKGSKRDTERYKTGFHIRIWMDGGRMKNEGTSYKKLTSKLI